MMIDLHIPCISIHSIEIRCAESLQQLTHRLTKDCYSMTCLESGNGSHLNRLVLSVTAHLLLPLVLRYHWMKKIEQ